MNEMDAARYDIYWYLSLIAPETTSAAAKDVRSNASHCGTLASMNRTAPAVVRPGSRYTAMAATSLSTA
jgi:hypothetical protein